MASEKAQRTRAQILSAAAAVFGELGYSRVTVDSIAERAGVSKGVVYYHFKNKAAIAHELLESWLTSIADEVAKASREAKSAHEAFGALVARFVSFVYEDRAEAAFVAVEFGREGREWSGMMHQLEVRVIDLLAHEYKRGQNEGIVRKEIDPRFAAVATVGTLLNTTISYAASGEMGAQEYTECVIDYLRHAVGTTQMSECG